MAGIEPKEGGIHAGRTPPEESADSLTLQFKYTVGDLREAVRADHRPPSKNWCGRDIGPVLAAFLFGGFTLRIWREAVNSGQGIRFLFTVPALSLDMIWVLWVLGILLLAAARAWVRRRWAQQCRNIGCVTVKFGLDGYVLTDSSGTEETPWARVTKFCETRSLFLVYEADVYKIILKRGTATEKIQFVRRVLETRVMGRAVGFPVVLGTVADSEGPR